MNTVFSVSEFISEINSIITGEFTIEGEISQYKISQNKWIFFDLKDANSCLNCFSTVFMLRTPLEEGMKVRVTGYPKIHDKSGRFSFTVQKVELVGEGAMQRAYMLLKQKLTDEGLFNLDRKRPLPFLPSKIGVIASRDSAAWGDFKRILTNRWGGIEIFLYHTTVQGESAIKEIVEAFREFNLQKDPCEVLVLIRGGGSLEDLAAFNSEEVVRAMYGSSIPVICGVGHERDETLADLAADVRASTPSNAAEIVVPNRKDFTEQIDFEIEHITQTIEHAVSKKRQSIFTNFNFIVNTLSTHTQKIKNTIEQFWYTHTILQKKLVTYKEFISMAQVLFKNVNPKHILERGFSITRNQNGQIIRSKKDVDSGDKIMIELAQGIIKGEVV